MSWSKKISGYMLRLKFYFPCIGREVRNKIYISVQRVINTQRSPLPFPSPLVQNATNLQNSW